MSAASLYAGLRPEDEVRAGDLADWQPLAKGLYSVALCGARAVWKPSLSDARFLTAVGEHPNVVGYRGFVKAPRVGTLLELVPGGSLEDAGRARGAAERTRLSWVLDAARGMQHLHRHRVVYRDLALRNVLLAHDRAVLCDFGWSQWLPEGSDTLVLPPVEYGPLRVMDASTWSEASDVWSLGVLAYVVATDRRPYEGVPADSLREAVVSGTGPGPLSGVPLAAPSLAPIASMCLCPAARQRPPVSAVIAALVEALAKAQ
eukprot:m51a1_g13420 putative serine threonine-protein kinase nek8 (260) ;mRNA; r:692-1814